MIVKCVVIYLLKWAYKSTFVLSTTNIIPYTLAWWFGSICWTTIYHVKKDQFRMLSKLIFLYKFILSIVRKKFYNSLIGKLYLCLLSFFLNISNQRSYPRFSSVVKLLITSSIACSTVSSCVGIPKAFSSEFILSTVDLSKRTVW